MKDKIAKTSSKTLRIKKRADKAVDCFTFSNESITINITPVSKSEQQSKTVKGYRYLTIN